MLSSNKIKNAISEGYRKQAADRVDEQKAEILEVYNQDLPPTFTAIAVTFKTTRNTLFNSFVRWGYSKRQITDRIKSCNDRRSAAKVGMLSNRDIIKSKNEIILMLSADMPETFPNICKIIGADRNRVTRAFAAKGVSFSDLIKSAAKRRAANIVIEKQNASKATLHEVFITKKDDSVFNNILSIKW